MSAVASVASAPQRLGAWLCWLYYQYKIHLGICMLEPWEIKLLNSVFVLLLATTIYTTYIFLPGHLTMWAKVVNGLFMPEGAGGALHTGEAGLGGQEGGAAVS